MKTKLISSFEENHPGYGAGDGDVEYYEYECLCGNGSIMEEHENIPGFRSHDVYIKCDICRGKYELDVSEGKRNWKLVKK